VKLAADMLKDDPRPLWVSFTLEDKDAKDVLAGRAPVRLRSGETIAEAAKLALDLGVAALLFNCSQPEVMERAVREAKSALAGSGLAIGVYANAFATEADDIDANESLHDIRKDLTPPLYLGWAQKWVDAGASIVGGCCGIGPEHIEVLARDLA
jgi:S-methylmethionine-dependent homocysteine/selenocysteine methylase